MRFALSFATAHWVVNRVLYHTTNMGTNSKPTRSAGFTVNNILMLFVANLPYNSHTLQEDQPKLPTRHTHIAIFAFLGHKLS